MEDTSAVYGDKIVLLSQQLRSGTLNISNIPYLIVQIIENEMWRNFAHPSAGQTIDNRNKSFAWFVEEQPPNGLGSHLKTIKKILSASGAGTQEDIEMANHALSLFTKETTGKQGGDHGNQYTGGKHDSIMLATSEQGTSKSYALQRLEKQRQDIYERVMRGEISAHAGMVEAGFRKKRISCYDDPDSAITMLRNKFTPLELEIIKGKLTSPPK